MRLHPAAFTVVVVLTTFLFAQRAAARGADEFESAIQNALIQAGDNRSEIERALKEVPEDQAPGMRFLVANMPKRDLEGLTAEFLLENSELAHKALASVPWSKDLPDEVFLNNLLPYANINETRDRWRKDFYDRFLPLIKDAKTPSEAAAILNQKVFPELQVKYSTQRRKADQSPLESMESGLASCTGLSVLLVDACRAVGVPARIVGTPLWSDRSGNHTWVEIWDQGWHFTGACEPTGNKLDEAWFTGRASQAQRDHRLHAIYAVTFQKNGQTFPMVWASGVDDVYAVNVTDRYTAEKQEIPEGHAVVRFRVVDPASGQRVAAEIQVLDAQNQIVFSGKSNDERFDANDHLTGTLPIGASLTAVALIEDETSKKSFEVLEGEQLVSIDRQSREEE